MRIVFFGASELGYKCCEMLINRGHNVVGIFTIPKTFSISYSKDKPITNVLHKDFQSLGEEYRIPVYSVEGNMASYYEKIKSLNPDFLLVIGWYYMIPKSIREIATKGCAGIHASLLPKYRGGAPLVWAIINGEKDTGISFFYFEDGVDDGDIIAQRSFPIEDNDTIADLLKKVEYSSLAVLEEYVPLIGQGKATRITQNNSLATYVPQRKPEDGEINWDWEPDRIKNFIRAQTKPYPGAYTVINRKKIIIWDADILEEI